MVNDGQDLRAIHASGGGTARGLAVDLRMAAVDQARRAVLVESKLC